MKLKKAVLLAFVLVFSSVSIFAESIKPVEASGTIYIRADGSVEGTTRISSADNLTYAFTDNINDSIVVERSNIVIDGAGYILQGTGSGTGILLSSKSNVTIKKMKITTFDVGIHFDGSSSNMIFRNNITNNDYGIFSFQSLNNYFSGNRITNNGYGVKFYECSKNNFSENEITNNRIGFMFDFSSNNSFSGNNISSNSYGIYVKSSPNNNISINNITSNQYGIVLSGPYMYGSGENIVYGNDITYNSFGIQVISPGNSIHGNNVTNNEVGIKVGSESNAIYYNNLINNTKQVQTEAYSFFQLNYWSDYTGKDGNGDNIGDTPYGGYELDRYPLMKPWSIGWSPKPEALVDQDLEEEIPFWMQWWFWTIIIVVIVASVGTIYLLKRGKPPTSTVPPLPSEGIT